MFRLRPLLTLLFFLPMLAHAQSNGSFWQFVSEQEAPTNLERQIVPQKYKVVRLDYNAIRQFLAAAPMEARPMVDAPLILELPMPDGTLEQFEVVESPIMEEPLYSNFPEIRTYGGQGMKEKSATIRLDVTPQGFHGYILSEHGTIYIDPFGKGNTDFYISYWKKDFATSKVFECHEEDKHLDRLQGDPTLNPDNKDDKNPLPDGYLNRNLGGGNPNNNFFGDCSYRNYRIAIAATGEYTAFHGGTVALAQAAQVTTMNRVNGVYMRDCAIRMNFIGNNNAIIYTNAGTDPYTNGDAGLMINENQVNLDAVILTANYDVGHVFGTNSGGLAPGPVCLAGNKAKGITGSFAPVGDPFDIDYVAHELGHQFGAGHTQNNDCVRWNNSAYETGSGVTIMGYAGICNPNVAANSIDNFHAISLLEIANYVVGAGNACASHPYWPNTAPYFIAGTANTIIPRSTPFELSAAFGDTEGDPRTYVWEQYDREISLQPPAAIGTNGPNFRCFSPTTSGVRVFPRIQDIINNVSPTWEVLPSITRDMHFRCTSRDNYLNIGCTGQYDVTVSVDGNSGPFVVTYPSAAGLVFNGNEGIFVTWNVASTNLAPVSSATVNIYLSTDGGFTYPTLLATNVPNDGSESVTLPNVNTTTARIKVKSYTRGFFDISNNNFTINAIPQDFDFYPYPIYQISCGGASVQYEYVTIAQGGFSDPITFSASNLPAGAVASFSPNPVSPGGSSYLTLTGLGNSPDGHHVFNVTGTSTPGPKTYPVDLHVYNNAPPAPVLASPANGTHNVGGMVNLTWFFNPSSTSFTVQLATDANFTNNLQSFTTAGYTASFGNLLASTRYYWRVYAVNACYGSGYSTVWSFFTSNSVCTTVASVNVPVVIPSDQVTSVSSSIYINAPGNNPVISDLNVYNLIGTHSWINDLSFSLTSPSGTTVQFMGQVCGSQDDFNISFDDSAFNPYGNIPCPPTDGQVYQPLNPLSAFNGQQANGFWTLTVNDAFAEDGGSLDGWSLYMCTFSENICGMVVTPAVINTCENLETGQAIGATIGGTGPYNYLWDNQFQGPSLNNQPAGTYSVTAYDANGCSATGNYTIYENPAPTVSIVSDPVAACDGTPYTLAASANNDPLRVYYLRSSGGEPWGQTANIDALNAVYGANGWTLAEFETASPGIIFDPYTQLVFMDGSDIGSVPMNAFVTANISMMETWVSNGGRLFMNAAPNGGGNMNWGFGGTTLNYPVYAASVVATIPGHPVFMGPYTPVTTSYTGNYFSHGSITGTNLTSALEDNGNIVLASKNYGSGTVIFGGMVVSYFQSPNPEAQNLRQNIFARLAQQYNHGYSYLWSGGQTSGEIAGLGAGTYDVTVTELSGCQGTATISVNPLPAPNVIVTPAANAVCDGFTTTLTASGADTYLWSTGQTDATITVGTGFYTVTGTGMNGCTASASDFVESYLPPAVLIDGPTEVCQGSQVEILVRGALNYLWSTGETTTTILAGVGTYTVTGTDDFGCTASYTHTVNPAASQVLFSEDFDNVGGPTIGGPGTYDFPSGWALFDVDGLTPSFFHTYFDDAWERRDDYSNNVFDSVAFSHSWYDPVGQSDDWMFTPAIPITTNGLLSWEALAYDPAFSDGYEVYVSTSPDPATAQLNSPVFSIPAEANVWTSRSVSLAAYAGQTVYIAFRNHSVDKFLLLIDDVAVTGDCPIINQCDLSTNIARLDATCAGNDGLAEAQITGGTPNYTFLWSNGATDQVTTGLAPGMYSVTVVDANGCSASDSQEIFLIPDLTSPFITCPATQNLSGQFSVTLPDYSGMAEASDNCGTVTVTQSFPAPGTVYNTSQTVNVTLMATDGSGNMSTCIFDVVINISGCNFATSIDPPNSSICAGNTTFLSATNGVSWAWSTGANTQSITALGGTYTVTVTDGNGCVATASAIVTEFSPISVNIARQDATCAGNDGLAEAQVTGGTPNYTYQWSNGATDQIITGLAPGIYSVTVIDANGCAVSDSQEIFLAPDATPPTITCPATQNLSGQFDVTLPDYSGMATASDNCGSVTVTQSFPAPGTVYNASQTVNVTLMATDGSGNMATCIFDVVINIGGCNFTTSIDPPNASICAGNTALLSATNGVSWAWSTGANTQSITALGGTYTVTVTDGNGCVATANAVVTEFSPISVNIARQDATCAGNDGLAEAQVTGGTPNYTYQWSNGATDQIITGLAPGIYSVTVIDANGCAVSDSQEIFLAPDATPPTITCPATQNLSGQFDVTLPDYSGMATASDNCGSVTVTQSFPAPGTVYNTSQTVNVTLMATDGSGNMATCIFDVVINISGCNFATSIDPPNASICAGNTAFLSATNGVSWAWSTGANTQSITALGGTYTVTVTDGNGCVATASAIVTEFSPISVNIARLDATCAGNDGSAEALITGGTPSYTFLWSNGATDQIITGLAPGVYSVTVVDANGCAALDDETIELIPDLTSPFITCPATQNLSDPTFVSLPDYSGMATATDNCGSVTVTQSFPAPGTVYNTSQTVNVTLMATDGSGNMSTCIFDVNITIGGCAASITAGEMVVCAGNTTTLSASNGDTWTWSTGANTQDIVVGAGTYTVSVSDGQGCTAIASITITESPAMTFSGIGDGTCAGETNGVATIIISGGTAPYSYDFGFGGSTNNSLTGLAAGTYPCTVTDAAGCIIVASATVPEFTPPTASATSTDASCPNGTDGMVDLTASGGAGNYSYLWSNGEVTEDIFGLMAGVYTVTVTDGNGCSATASATVGTMPDVTSPSIVCPGTQTLSGLGSVTLPDYSGMATATDNCGNATVTQSFPAPGTVYNSSQTIGVTLMATDGSGNMSTCIVDVVIVVGGICPPTPGVIYVDDSAVGANNGSSWADAFTSLQSALAAAVSGNQIWVAEGTYKPGISRTTNFTMKAGVSLYGGFPNGGACTLLDRDWIVYQTNLSGDIGIIGDHSDNSSRIVQCKNIGANVTVDGFIIRDALSNSSGGGIGITADNNVSSPMFRHCYIQFNTAPGKGAGCYITTLNNGSCNPTFEDCHFWTNISTANDGGGMATTSQSGGTINATLTACSFDNNNADLKGGGIANAANAGGSTTMTIDDGYFAGNIAGNNGGAVWNYSRSGANCLVVITNSEFDGNSAQNGPAVYSHALNAGSTINTDLQGCVFTNNASAGYGAACNYSQTAGTADMDIDDCSFTGNTAANGGGNANISVSGGYSILHSQRCLFVGNSGQGGAVSTHSTGANSHSFTNLGNCILRGNSAPSLGGAVSSSSTTNGQSFTQLAHCTIYGNTAGTYGGVLNNNAAGTTTSTVNLVSSIAWNNVSLHPSGRDFRTTGTGAATYAQYTTVAQPVCADNSNGTGLFDCNNTQSSDPLFVDAPNGDFHLTAGSPAIDFGTNASYTDDYDGNIRPVGIDYDMGAFEYQGPRPLARMAQTELNARAYPNPTEGITTVAFDRAISGTLRVTTLDGRFISTQQLTHEAQVTLDLSEQHTGLYLVTILEDNHLTVLKLSVF